MLGSNERKIPSSVPGGDNSLQGRIRKETWHEKIKICNSNMWSYLL